jgi:hypothetical protein
MELSVVLGLKIDDSKNGSQPSAVSRQEKHGTTDFFSNKRLLALKVFLRVLCG